MVLKSGNHHISLHKLLFQLPISFKGNVSGPYDFCPLLGSMFLFGRP